MSNTPILPQQDASEWVHPRKGAGTYSNYAIWTTTHLFDGAPHEDHEPGDGRHPHGLMMSRWYRGLQPAGEPTKDPGKGTRLEGFRFRPLTYKGIEGIISGSYGHHDRVTSTSRYSNWVFDGLEDLQALRSTTLGHAARGIGEDGAAATFGRFQPLDYLARCVNGTSILHGGQDKPDRDHLLGHNRVNEWNGITRAL